MSSDKETRKSTGKQYESNFRGGTKKRLSSPGRNSGTGRLEWNGKEEGLKEGVLRTGQKPNPIARTPAPALKTQRGNVEKDRRFQEVQHIHSASQVKRRSRSSPHERLRHNRLILVMIKSSQLKKRKKGPEAYNPAMATLSKGKEKTRVIRSLDFWKDLKAEGSSSRPQKDVLECTRFLRQSNFPFNARRKGQKTQLSRRSPPGFPTPWGERVGKENV